MTQRRHVSDEGFTLVEALIAMVIMTVAVLVLVGGMGTLIVSNQQHRGHALTETAAKGYGQAVQAKAAFHTVTQSALPSRTDPGYATTTTVDVADVSGLSGVRYIAVDQETLEITGLSGNTLSVTRARNDPASAVAHSVDAPVVAVLRCPTDTELQPAWTPPSETTVEILEIEPWDPVEQDFDPPADCPGEYDAACRYPITSGTAADIRQDCGSGMFRVGIAVTTEAEFRSVTTVTSVVIRRASP